METKIDEIAAGVFRFSTYIAKIDLQFNQFLVVDDEPLLYHTGLRGMFPEVSRAVARVLDPGTIRWISFSHFESDECGALNEWRGIAPYAEPVCGAIGALVNINDFIGGRARVLADGETFSTGQRQYRFLETPHVPHGWDASLLFEDTHRVLFCSDLFLHKGDCRALTEDDVVGPARRALADFEAGPLHDSLLYSPSMEKTLFILAELKPEFLALMHGASFSGDGASALRRLSGMYREMLIQRS
ncbi:MBL fold metallo-hydrolase [Geobacter sp. DSM 9736]|uniref:MBL fold metallo-hydrolase n=1 Tax=Geobacter sp. DSM 9736 TaxID=1277350 RepID=UPI000B506E56|nr:MBL fold metallo-hydrolase [Geobacter sp. DSM 9736]SNB44710.1 hypothetical protein SAMN06269301_0097 [Geobacter sp. DSM 9736]